MGRFRVLNVGGVVYLVGGCAHIERLRDLVADMERLEEDRCVARVLASKEEVLKRLSELGLIEEEVELFSPSLEHSVKQGLKLCPVCGSPKLLPIGVLGVMPTLYVCSDCGYAGYLVLEVSQE
uniref:Uncharacterized protein n=1 Tax=Thermofilum pendens TaxID=2269 RepID=A0A7C1TA11_THEPE